MPPEILACPFKSHPSDNKDQPHLHYGQRVDAWAVRGSCNVLLLVHVHLTGLRACTTASASVREQCAALCISIGYNCALRLLQALASRTRVRSVRHWHVCCVG